MHLEVWDQYGRFPRVFRSIDKALTYIRGLEKGFSGARVKVR